MKKLLSIFNHSERPISPKKRLQLLLPTFAALFALLSSCLLIACSGSASGPVYMPSRITTYNKTNNSATNNYLTYDSSGNLTSLVQETLGGPGTHFDFETGDITRYSGSKTVDNYDVALDQNGLATSVTYWQENNYGGTNPTPAEIITETNEKGQIASINVDPDEAVVGILHSKTYFTYDNSGNISSVNKENGSYTSVYEYNEDGWQTAGSVIGGYVGNVSSQYDLVKDSNGKVIGVKYKNIQGGEDTVTFEYDDEGCISLAYLNGNKRVEIEYTTIDTPSATARAFSQLKIWNASPLVWIPFMK